MVGVFDAIIKGRNNAIRRAAAKDPKFRQAIRDLERGADELERFARARSNNQPME